jgi:hypothetical protein
VVAAVFLSVALVSPAVAGESIGEVDLERLHALVEQQLVKKPRKVVADYGLEQALTGGVFVQQGRIGPESPSAGFLSTLQRCSMACASSDIARNRASSSPHPSDLITGKSGGRRPWI